ncbi:hypothetical protein ON010_g10404 [Phytophthora cinnamomi]|nr:hypothetical protein ON010_g10404 [Phytophthora cinnamomi]
MQKPNGRTQSHTGTGHRHPSTSKYIELAELDTPSSHSYFESAVLLAFTLLALKLVATTRIAILNNSRQRHHIQLLPEFAKQRQAQRLREDVREVLARRAVAHFKLSTLVEVAYLMVLQVHALRTVVALALRQHGDCSQGCRLWH